MSRGEIVNNQTSVDVQSIVEAVVKLWLEQDSNGAPAPAAGSPEGLDDITSVDIRQELLVDNPHNKEAYLRLKSRTPARLGIGKSGARYNTHTMLRIRADLAAAKDAVWTMVDPDVPRNHGLPTVRTQVEDKAQFLLRPDLGRIFDEQARQTLRRELKSNVDVQIVIGDGLSSAAIEANIDDIPPALQQGLRTYGIDPGTPVFVEFARVGAGDFVAQEVDAKLVIVLIGERPGVASSTSLSCYMTYAPKIGMKEAGRTVISNIHRQGTPPAEAGAHIAELAKIMLDKQSSGIGLGL